jgi:hypothetical protein
MAFRQRRDDWSEFLRENAETLRACGIPDEVLRVRVRFFVFLDHGFDQWGWSMNPHTFFHSSLLSDKQIARLACFVAEHFGEQYRVVVASRWQRAW